MSSDLLARDAFAAWLRSLAPETVLQSPACHGVCAPCAFERFLAHVSGCEGWDADPSGYVNTPTGGCFAWPAWATDFYGVCYGPEGGTALTAGRALEILKEMP